MAPDLEIDRDGDTTTITLNRPEKRNALSADLVEALIDAVNAAHADGTALLILRGEGRNFSAGFDFGDISQSSEGDLLLRFVRIEMLLQLIDRAPFLTLGLAHGRTFGAGTDLFAVCKWRVCAPDAQFRMPGLKFGLVLGTRRFAALVGRDTARGILETARPFDAAEAFEIGFATKRAEPSAWPEIIAQAAEAARSLPDAARRDLYRALDDDGSDGNGDGDLARLVRSAAVPGLADRIRHFIAASR